jgi:hypothetical protein
MMITDHRSEFQEYASYRLYKGQNAILYWRKVAAFCTTIVYNNNTFITSVSKAYSHTVCMCMKGIRYAG